MNFAKILNSRWSKVFVFAMALMPLFRLAERALHGQLTANPVEFLQRFRLARSAGHHLHLRMDSPPRRTPLANASPRGLPRRNLRRYPLLLAGQIRRPQSPHLRRGSSNSSKLARRSLASQSRTKKLGRLTCCTPSAGIPLAVGRGADYCEAVKQRTNHGNVTFGLTIFLSAFLLFWVQLLLGKYILPWFGGTPAVWTTCMLFFQVLLLGGYIYAHVLSSSRLSAQAHGIFHTVLLGASLIVLACCARRGSSPLTPD